MGAERTVAVTGATGYLGSHICHAMQARGWHVAALVRNPDGVRFPAAPHDLGMPITAAAERVLRSADVLVHTAYDLRLTTHNDIRRVNVGGTQTLLDAAVRAGVPRILVLSSMSAYAGTQQLYGRAKLDIEAMTLAAGGTALRPGLVYGSGAGGMAGALRRLAQLPVTPVVSGGAYQYTVRESDLSAVVAAMAEEDHLDPRVVSVAHPTPVPLRDLLGTFAAMQDRRCRFVPVPWQLVYAVLRLGETLRFPVPFRSDSLLGLVRSAPAPVNDDAHLRAVGLALDAFPSGGRVHPLTAS